MANIQPVHSPCYCINYRRAANTLTKYYDAAFAPIGLTGEPVFPAQQHPAAGLLQQERAGAIHQLGPHHHHPQPGHAVEEGAGGACPWRKSPQQRHSAQRERQKRLHLRPEYLANPSGSGTAGAGRGQSAHPRDLFHRIEALEHQIP